MNLNEMKQKVADMQKKIKEQEVKAKPTGRVTLEFLDAKGNKIRSFKHLSKQEAFKLQRDLYKLIVTSMKQKISMRQIPETKRA